MGGFDIPTANTFRALAFNYWSGSNGSKKDEEEILKTYKLHANCYITKPVDLDGFSKIVKAIEDFWFVVAKLPRA